ncbi:MAG: aminopeptidase [Lachnospiraceae bacterium]|nr:aminopeptidase [Lachnospiraceae bacterium]
MENKTVWKKYSAKQLKELDTFAANYIDFISECKTERECTDYLVNILEEKGYSELSRLIADGKKLKAGDKVYSVNKNKGILAFHIGKEDLENGMNILGAHIDSPRLDVKANPLYEDGGLAYLDTHYYGGIKKYQWVTIPLAIHGVVIKKDLSTTIIELGEEPNDPVFFISDLLIHLSQEQLEKKAAKVIEGEALDIIIGSRPEIETDKENAAMSAKSAVKTAAKNSKAKEKEDCDKDAVKKSILAFLKQYYDMEEEDFLSAELEIVPAGRARECGLDRSMIMGYGHDDRCCAYPSLRALVDSKTPNKTACCILVDKEEIGSVGATGMKSQFFENTVAELLALCGKGSDLAVHRCLANSNMLSSDVSSAFDPTYASSFDKKNVAYLGKGMVLCKFTGARGKSGSNDANAEYLGKLRSIFADDDVSIQLAELGRVDLGGGGTIAYILARYGMNVIDCGVAVLNMHAPFEVISKADIYETYRGYLSFIKNM